MSKKVGTYDLETGEVLNPIIINDLNDIQIKKEFVDKRKSDNEFKKFIDENLGNFYFLFYKMLSKGIKRQYIVRFLYLCTYMNYENNLLFGNASGNGKFMLEKDLQEVLKIGATETRTTKKVLLENDLIEINENKNIHIIDKYCLKGTIPNNKKKTCKIRIFEDGIKELYEKSKPKEHKKIGLLIEILPYINLKYNIICENPDSELIKEITPINLTKLAELTGYGNNKNSTQKLKRGLFDITVNNELVIMLNETAKGKFITVNPRVYYKGTHVEDVQYLANLFKISNKL